MKWNVAILGKGDLSDFLYKAAALGTLAAAGYFVVAFTYLAASRIGYPFALEWLEGGSYLQVQRVLAGQPLYARPSMEYVAMIYPPLYYFASAVVARLLGFNLSSLRLVSLASSWGVLMLIFLIVRQHGGGTLPAFLGSGLFAATYHLSGSWFDIARVDMLAVFLVLLAVWLLQLKAWPWQIAAGLSMAMACLTKQVHLITLIGLMLYLAFFERKKLITFGVTSLAVLASAILALDRLYDGWFSFFVLKLALGSGEFVTFDPGMFAKTARDFWAGSILLALPIVVLCTVIFAILTLRGGRHRADLLFFLAVATGMIATSWSVVQVGGYKNDLVPAYAAIALLFGFGLHHLMARAAFNPLLGAALLAACIIQFALLWYPFTREIPSQEDRRAGDTLLAQIRGQSGEVYLPFHPELALMAGKQPFASWSPMYQLEGNFGGGDIRTAGRVKTEFTRAMERQQFSMIILDQEPNWIWGDPERFYTRSREPVFAEKDVFWPVTGWQTRPEILLLPTPK